MKIFSKILLIIVLFSSTIFSFNFGVRAFGAYVDGAGIGKGAGFFSHFEMNEYVTFYPGIDFMHSHERNGSLEHTMLFMDIYFNTMLRYEFIEGITGYIGAGLVPQAYASKWKPARSRKYSPKTDIGGDCFLGIECSIGKKKMMMEIQQELTTEYDATKLYIGFIF